MHISLENSNRQFFLKKNRYFFGHQNKKKNMERKRNANKLRLTSKHERAISPRKNSSSTQQLAAYIVPQLMGRLDWLSIFIKK